MNEENWNKTQSSAGEAGANLTDVLERRSLTHQPTFRFVMRPVQYLWTHKANILPGDVDCTDMDDDVFEQLVRLCDEWEADRWAIYKWQKPFCGTENGRDDPVVMGEADGAGNCAARIRARSNA